MCFRYEDSVRARRGLLRDVETQLRQQERLMLVWNRPEFRNRNTGTESSVGVLSRGNDLLGLWLELEGDRQFCCLCSLSR